MRTKFIIGCLMIFAYTVVINYAMDWATEHATQITNNQSK